MKQFLLLGLLTLTLSSQAATSFMRYSKTQQIDSVTIYEKAEMEHGLVKYMRTEDGQVMQADTFHCTQVVSKDTLFAIFEAYWACRNIFSYTAQMNTGYEALSANQANLSYAIGQCDVAIMFFERGNCPARVQEVTELKSALMRARNISPAADQIAAIEKAKSTCTDLLEVQPCGYLY
ncbi:MAG: hypothetical protein MJZ65_04245 [Paludibacteraceae bacterium]|nr:hypothetical protein [Paludibacteraceae bacterium]